ncbi:ABC transporter permease [Rhodoferax antarcticus]|uniref:ABC transporter n=1 Tax=Rhodoferax antarcticus ANT.BR TaxID=1111071 RepID=A0A1Q8YJM1_9BURK|nr:ABC transporter permease [Rhodoferax antarcticus]APW47687.1 ABC transporter permease [Rhodoferax antarcticus]MCW2312505.1 ABC-2 type transport system permease protein [Rhodoferax antarcticus]OLP08212.1 ABC transporter [Rhodoferax antarcticus ANT.BR]
MFQNPFVASLFNIYRLGLKELRSLVADKVLLALIIWAFSGGIYVASTASSTELHNAPVAVVDEDHSPLSRRLVDALYPPYFKLPQQIALRDVDPVMDQGLYSFALIIPAHFQSDLVAGRHPEVQLNIDATNMSQSFIGASYIQAIAAGEITEFLTGKRDSAALPIKLVTRVRFNPNLNGKWFGGVMEVISNVTMLTIILVGAALIREREHGTIEHLLVMPLAPFEIMLAKIWANGLAVLVGVIFAMTVMLQWVLKVPIAGSVPLFVGAAALYLFAAASIGIFLATLARSMPQLGLLIILTIIPLQLLSGGVTPRESMPEVVQNLMLAAPTTYFVRLAQAILYRGAGLDVVWVDMLSMLGVGSVFFVVALLRFRSSVTQTQV